MKNNIKQKFIAGILLTAFAVSNVALTTFAYDGYADAPYIRGGSQGISTLDYHSNVKISNADSIVNLSLREADVTQVLRMFADQAGMNIIFYPSVEGTVTMDLVDITLEKALELVLVTNELSYDIQANTLIIYKKGDNIASGKRQISTIPVKYVSTVALASFLNNNIFTPNGIHPGVSTKPVVVVNSETNELLIMGTANDAEVARQIVEQLDKKPKITTYRVNHTTPAEMAALVCGTLLPSLMSGSSSGGGGGGGSTGGGATGGAAGIAGVPTGFASDSSMTSGGGGSSNGISVGGGKLACTLDQDASSTVSSSNSEESFESFNLRNLTITYFPTLGTIQVIGGSEGQLEMISDYIAANDKKTPQAYLEIQMVSLSEAGSKTFDNTWQFLSKSFSFNAGGGSGFATNSQYPVFFAGKGYYLTNGEWDDEKGAYEITGKVGKWGTSPQLVYTVNYLVTNRKGRVLANPRVLLTSGQQSTIDLTSDYVAKVTTQYLDSTSGSGSSQVQRDYDIQNDNGIKVTVTPFISPDGYITLDIEPEYSTIADRIYAPGEGEGQDLLATLLQRRNLSLKGVRIKDGETLVIGGLIQETETKSVNKIPFLGDLPLIGMFFRSTGTDKNKEEMVIMLTPQILVDTEDSNNEVEDSVDEVTL